MYNKQKIYALLLFINEIQNNFSFYQVLKIIISNY